MVTPRQPVLEPMGPKAVFTAHPLPGKYAFNTVYRNGRRASRGWGERVQPLRNSLRPCSPARWLSFAAGVSAIPLQQARYPSGPRPIAPPVYLTQQLHAPFSASSGLVFVALLALFPVLSVLLLLLRARATILIFVIAGNSIGGPLARRKRRGVGDRSVGG